MTIEKIGTTFYCRGSELPENLQHAAKRAYVHRFTGDNHPAWAGRLPQCPLQFKDDAEWLANTLFPVSASGRILLAASCISTPTWPNGTGALLTT